jgi:hypothetical protein
VTRARAAWDFPYEPSRREQPAGDDPLDVVVATRGDVGAARIARALRDLGDDLAVEPIIARAPLFWARVRSPRHVPIDDVTRRLDGLEVRYVVDAHRETMTPAPALTLTKEQRARIASGIDWPVRKESREAPTSKASGRWFLAEGGGVNLDRAVCGTGVGTRLAVIDDEAADVQHLEIDRVTCVGVDRAPATTGHAALMVAWATCALPPGGPRFVGVAPDASARLYCIPKPGVDVVSLPLAIARAVFDGADVVVCAAYVEGNVSPLLDDALDVAVHLGRRGRGTAVLLPTGRETSSPGNSIHASLSLGLGDPASDPRVHCIAPGGRAGGWFLWQSPRGQIRPFANRGPAVRWMTPGDDIAYPFSARERLFHAESSGASAIAAGVALLVLGCNAGLRLHELHALLTRTVDAPAPEADDDRLADPADVLPSGYDRDGHNAKSGYGRINATRACAAALDPFALELVAMGHDAVATRWAVGPRPYSTRLARWTERALLRRADLGHSVRAILRHARLVGVNSRRGAAHARGALVRQLAILGRELLRMRPPPLVRAEIARWVEAAGRAGLAEAEAFERTVSTHFIEPETASHARDTVLTAAIGS